MKNDMKGWRKIKNYYYKTKAKILLSLLKKFEAKCYAQKLFDEQWYLDFQDMLNALSIDRDRIDNSTFEGA